MTDLIGRQAVLDGKMVAVISGQAIDVVPVSYIKDLPSAQPERKRGKWIDEPNCWYRCSYCKSHYPSIKGTMEYNFCPNCGADMREETDDAEI